MASHQSTLNEQQVNGQLSSQNHGSQPIRVVITGMGAITPLGLSVQETWEALQAGRSGVDQISRFDTSELRTTFAAEVRNFDTHQLYGSQRGAPVRSLYAIYAGRSQRGLC